MRYPFAPLAALAIAALIQQPAHAEPEVLWLQKVTTVGRHNAFTDLAKWKGDYYLCYRHGESHGSMDGEIHVLRSGDMRDWEHVGRLRTPGDDRDPHFTVTPDALFVYFGTWDLKHSDGDDPPSRWRVRSHMASTKNGTDWSRVKALYEPGWWLWRVRYLDGTFYTAAYTALRPTPDKRETRLLKSDTGRDFEFVSTVTDEGMSGEADMWLEDGGSMSLITRTGGNAVYYRSNPAMTEWEGTPLDALIHAPVTAEWEGRRFVVGRARGEDTSVTRIWEFDGKAVTPVLTLPSGGDTSYAGLIVEPEGEGQPPVFYVSWYSQRDATTGNMRPGRQSEVYTAALRLTE